ncbi:MAG: 4Fe-4S binding protein [Smithellaceae bacterium]|nr:4Fe-4S binding protein [Smithellaceae bacterium]
MTNADIYQELAKKLGQEQSPLIPRLWQVLCTEQEARIVNSTPAQAEELAEKFDMALDETRELLGRLFRRGVIFEQQKEGKTIYRMPRHMVQFHDATSLWPEAPLELLDLWAEYMEKEYPQIPAFMTKINADPFLRVIPIKESLSPESRVLPFEDAAQIVEGAYRIAVTNCPCRTIARKCDKPLEVCLQLNRGADYTIKRGAGREINATEAKEILRQSAAAGLVHMTETKAGIGNVICNCCNCCCIALPYARDAATKGIVQASRYRANLAADLCNNCDLCRETCPVEAIAPGANGVPLFLGDSCLGCGLCTAACPAGAISLLQVRGEDFIRA